MQFTKWCPKCQKHVYKSEFTNCKSAKDGLSSYCGPCKNAVSKAWRVENSEYFKRHKRAYYQANREQCLATDRQKRRKLRDEFLAAYGGCCTCCGETEDAFLTLEHLNNDGSHHRAEINAASPRGGRAGGLSVLRDLKKRGWPKDGYTLLCWNCNLGKALRGVCPHESKRKAKR